MKSTFLRNTQGELIAMKKQIIEKCINKVMKCKDGASFLQMHPKAFSRLKKRYLEYGVSALMPIKSGPKCGRAHNKTSSKIEDLVVLLGSDYSHLGPQVLADILQDVFGIKINSVTVWRILKRKRIRYTQNYIQIPKRKPKFYCLDEPGEEIQMDGSYPFGRSRKILCFDAIDDCSRRAYTKVYQGTENTENAINFVNELISVSPFKIQRIRIDNRLSKRFDEYCRNLGIEVIRNDAYEPKQNGKVERYHRTIKRNLFWMLFNRIDNVETLNYKTKLWLMYYNGHRRHGGYGMDRMTPNGKIASILAKTTYNYYFSLEYPQKVTSTMQQYKT